MTFVIRFILAALAIYRVAMFTREDGPGGVFSIIRVWLGKRAAKVTLKTGFELHGFWWSLAEISNCPHCVGVWLALLVAPAVVWPSTVTDIILIILALAGAQSYLTGRGEE